MTTIGTWTAADDGDGQEGDGDEQPPAELTEPIEPDRHDRVAVRRRVRSGSDARGSEIAALDTASTKATTGIAANSPTIPASAAPAGRAMSASAGWMSTVL